MARKKTADKDAAAACGMNVDQWNQVRQQAGAARTRGRRPSGTAGCDTKLATWGPVEDQMTLFTDSPQDGAA
ncbi:hypothetical protein ABZ863_11700 [Saccharomonospora sp. NPDC046836]|uniref:hypothetical protein n=1 Tax=Saccharomonospora sp. NPDC046836 TaxID=3156921 RepID=UPI0034106286